MNLLPCIILGYLAVGVQVGLSGFVHLGPASPNLVLIVAVFLALQVPRDAARLACFALGLMQDLLTQQTLGLYAISYGLVGVVIGNSQAMVYRDRPLTHAAATAVGAMLTWTILLIHGWAFGPGAWFGMAFYSTVLSVLIAPLVMWGLLKLRPLLGICVARRF
jgi:rod shape-determining protein MreD